MSFVALSEVLNSYFCFELCLKSQNYKISKLIVSEIVKMAIFEIQFSLQKWQMNSRIEDLNITF